jgi:hypothetical protein
MCVFILELRKHFYTDHCSVKKKIDDRTTLLILDRTIDPVAPVLHEFTYQAMIYDLIDIKKGSTYTYTYNNGNKDVKKEVLLDEYDFLWPKLRHMHIADCINKVIDDFNAFLKTNKAVKLNNKRSGVTSLKEMAAAMKELPQFQEMFAKVCSSDIIHLLIFFNSTHYIFALPENAWITTRAKNSKKSRWSSRTLPPVPAPMVGL